MNVLFSAVIAFMVAIPSFAAQAGIVVGMTRVIYPADKKEVTVNLKNTGDHAALVQSWIDMGDPLAAPESSHAPFVILPPLTRIDRGKGQTLRLLYTGGKLPEDRESIFWLNVLSVPPKNKTPINNTINVAYQTRIKLFYRPLTLNMQVSTAPKKLQWKKHSDSLIVSNPTPYYISLHSINLNVAGKNVPVNGEMILPYGHITLKLKGGFQKVNTLNYAVLDDNGQLQDFSSNVN